MIRTHDLGVPAVGEKTRLKAYIYESKSITISSHITGYSYIYSRFGHWYEVLGSADTQFRIGLKSEPARGQVPP
jgi:hypothetical protein